MKRADVQQVVRYEGELHEIVGIGEGRTVLLRPIKDTTCPTCHRPKDKHLLEHSPMFQDNVEPVKTIQPEGER